MKLETPEARFFYRLDKVLDDVRDAKHETRNLYFGLGSLAEAYAVYRIHKEKEGDNKT